MGSINKQISRFETTAVYTHPDAKVDIVLVHGLNGDPQKTWTAKNGVFWPSDLLPQSLSQRNVRANVLVYGYNADVYSKKHGANPSDNFIYMHAQTLVTSLTHYRKDELSSRNPIIWVCHSLGGILVKRALLYSNDLRASHHEDYRQIYVSTYGIIFLGTPHTGSDLGSWATMLQAMSDAVVPKAFWHSEPILLKTLKKDNETLQNINNHFLDIYQRFQILMAHENHRTDLKGTKMLVVDAHSASPQLPGVNYFGIEATHSGMCKFDSKNAPGYRTVATTIRDWVVEAPEVIVTRWRVEDDEKLARAKHEIEERMKPWLKSTEEAQQGEHGQIQDPNNQNNSPTSQKAQSKIDAPNKPLLPEPQTPDQGPELPSQTSTLDDSPFLVTPMVFRPNAYFKGRDKELKKLHKMVTDHERRSRGTSSVLIQSMPGGGKTHLARQYVFEHRHDFPGGMFWIRSKSVQELEYGYWDIAKTVGLEIVKGSDKNDLEETKSMVKAVRDWLSNTKKWLLVLDGIHFDYPNLEDFIPFAKHTSIIYTSTERSAGEDYQFDNPQVLMLDPLTTHDAQELLLEELGKKKPYSQDDLVRAKELVDLMDRLPLMVHVAALHLKATREPLSKYLRSFRSRPKVGGVPAYRAVREQLQHRGAVAALNLMSILAFFSQHVPVEMLARGLRALDKRTPVKTYNPEMRKASLNATFKILIAFALLERNESNETTSSSSRSSRSVDMAQDNLDILRLHGIVQAFFVDILAEEKQVAFWLERAVCVFCYAFDEANRQIEEDPTTGMPEDYRRFSIHGQKLSAYVDRFGRKHPELQVCQQLLDSRLGTIQDRIDSLSKRTKDSAQYFNGSPIVSVFDRTNSLSEVDSQTPPSNNSMIEWHFDDGDHTRQTESPSVYSPDDHNPYHWHVTYPYKITIEEDGETSRTVTPQLAPTEVFSSISVPEDDELPRSPTPSHRTIKRTQERRYRDHAGSWRASPQVVSDPRVSLSRETVKGFISPSVSQAQLGAVPQASSGEAVTASSTAELTLNKLKSISPPPLRTGPSSNDLKRDTIESATANARPQLITGRPSYAISTTAQTNQGDQDEPSLSPTFSNVMGTYPAPSSGYAAATIMALKENTNRPISTDGLAPVKISSPLGAPPLNSSASGSVNEQMSGEVRPSLDRITPPANRTARSSPSATAGPFRPPPIPIEINTTSALRTYSGPYSSTSQNTFEDDTIEQLTQSVPTLQSSPPSPPYPHAETTHVEPFISIHPPPWTPSGGARLERHPQGYSSQPMSRDPSHQSSNSRGSGHSIPPIASHLGLSSSPGSQIMQRPWSRRPSVVETEPSPRLGGFEIEPTSYQLYHETARGRGRKVRPRSWFSRIYRSRRVRSFSTAHSYLPVRKKRTESASARLVTTLPQGSPGPSPELGSLATPAPAFASTSSVPQIKSAAESMSRLRSGSGSGGIRLADGSVVGFGERSPSTASPPPPSTMTTNDATLASSSPFEGAPSGNTGQESVGLGIVG